MADAAALRGPAAGPAMHQSMARRAGEPPREVVLGLARARQRISLLLTVLVSGFGILFALTTGFAPAAMRLQLVPGLSWMMVSFFALVAFIFVMVCIYVFWAARYYDADWMLSHSNEADSGEGGA